MVLGLSGAGKLATKAKAAAGAVKSSAAAGKAVAGLGKVAGGAATKFAALGTGAKVAAGVAAGTALHQVVGAGKQISFLMIILGLVHHFIRLALPVENLYFTLILTLVLFVMAGYALSARVGAHRFSLLIPMLLFAVWYFIFQGNYDRTFLSYYLGISAAFLILPAILSKGDSIKPELYGFLPCIFLYLDIGMLPFLVEGLSLQITPLMESLILYMPWWAFFGLLTLPSDATENSGANALINITKVLGIIYLVFVFIAPTLPNVGYDTSIVPGPAQLEEAQARVRARLPQKEPLFVSHFTCIKDGRYSDMQVCVEEKQERSEIIYLCKRIRKYKPQTPEFDDCVAKELDRRRNPLSDITGTVDSTIREPTVFEFKVDDDFFPKEVVYADNPINYPITLEYKKPRKGEIEVSFGCTFTKKSEGLTIKGTISGSRKPANIISEEGSEFIICTPPDGGRNLKGDYELQFNATLSGMKTSSRLTRFFIGDKAGEARKDIINKIQDIERVTSLKKFASSLAPNEFARLNFGLGNVPKDPVIASDNNRNVFLALAVENTGSGRISSINSYAVNLDPLEAQSCSSKANVPIPLTKGSEKRFTLSGCEIEFVPESLKNPDRYSKREFVADLSYDYIISKKVKIKVSQPKDASEVDAGEAK